MEDAQKKKFIRSIFGSMDAIEIDHEIKTKYAFKTLDKLESFGHIDKEHGILMMYVKYYIAGYFAEDNFDAIVKDGAFHILGFEESKDFFLEVYFGNKKIVNQYKFETNKNPFETLQTKTDYKEWMIEKFTPCYYKYHKKIKF